MQFFQILSRRQHERVATRVTNSSEIRDKLKAARIAYFKRPGHYKNKHGRRPLDDFNEDIVLSTICILLLDGKKQTKEEEKKRSTWVRPWLTRRKERAFYHQLLTEITVEDAPAFRELLRMTKTQF